MQTLPICLHLKEACKTAAVEKKAWCNLSSKREGANNLIMLGEKPFLPICGRSIYYKLGLPSTCLWDTKQQELRKEQQLLSFS